MDLWASDQAQPWLQRSRQEWLQRKRLEAVPQERRELESVFQECPHRSQSSVAEPVEAWALHLLGCCLEEFPLPLAEVWQGAACPSRRQLEVPQCLEAMLMARGYQASRALTCPSS